MKTTLYVFILSSISFFPGHSQTASFPLNIGNKWYYRSAASYQPYPFGIVKEIVDTTSMGFRVIRIRNLHPDSTTFGIEYWLYREAKLFQAADSSISPYDPPVYNATLTRDTSFGNGGIFFSYHLFRATVFGNEHPAQSFLDGWIGGYSRARRAAEEVGFIYHSYRVASPPFNIDSMWLVGMYQDGAVYGDTLLHQTSVHDWASDPLVFLLSQNYPNPFNPSTNIGFQIADYGWVTLKVFDVLGREVAALVNEEMRPGTYERTFDASGLSSGIYFYRLSVVPTNGWNGRAGNFVTTRKLLVVK